MAVLSSLSVTGILRANSISNNGQQYTPWIRHHHCADAESTSICNPTYSCGWMHVRTPLPADANVQNIPSMVEVIGYHTYSGEYIQYFKGIVNTDENDSFQANVRVNCGNTTPRFYRSDSTHGGKRRVCFAMPKVGCCCNGWFWVRWRMNESFWNDYPWGIAAGANSTTNRF